MDMTNKQLLAHWDSGRPIKTVGMGGLGEDYELAIHTIAMEMLRYMVDNPFDWGLFQDDPVLDVEATNKLIQHQKNMEASPDVAELVDVIGPSGAQWSAAKSVATVFARQGYQKGLDMAPKNRIIEIININAKKEFT